MGALCIDVGNSRIKLGVFEKDELLEVHNLPLTSLGKIKDSLTNHLIENIIFSTVSADITAQLAQQFGKVERILNLSARTPLPIQNAYATPETLGKDRLAAVVGAYALYPGEHVLVADAGTCITFDLLTAAGTYEGGNISPGWRMRLDAMHHFTARLPRPEAEYAPEWVGTSTKTALQNGAFFGLLFEIEGYIQEIKALYGAVNVLLTGGDADFFAKKLKSEIFVHQNLVLQGLNKILNYNV